MRPRKGAYEENLCRLGELFRQAAAWDVAARAHAGSRGGADRLLPRGRRARPGRPGRAPVRRPLPAARDAGAPPLDIAHRLLRAPPEPALQLRAVRHAGRTARRHPPRAPQGLPPDLRRVRRGAFRRGGPQRAGVRYPLGPRGDPHLRGRLALVHADARGARRRPAHHHPEREPGPRHRSRRGREPAGHRAAVGAHHPGHRGASTGSTWPWPSWWASRAARRFPAARWWPGRAAICSRRAALRGGAHPGDRSTSRRSPGRAPTCRCWPIWRCGCRISWDRCMRQGGMAVRRYGGMGTRPKLRRRVQGRNRSTGPTALPPYRLSALPDRRSSGDRPRAHPPLAGRVPPRRDPAAARVREGGRGPLRRGGQLAGRLPRGGGARGDERPRRPDAVSHVQHGQSGSRPAGDRGAWHRERDGGHQRGGGRPRVRDRRSTRARAAWATSWPGPG